MRLKPICSVICVGAVLLAEGSHALYAPAEDRHPAIVRGESPRPADDEHRDVPAYVRLTSRGDLMAQTTGVKSRWWTSLNP
jgi:hypothetical protein